MAVRHSSGIQPVGELPDQGDLQGSLPHDSMVTVRLSETPALSLNTTSLADELAFEEDHASSSNSTPAGISPDMDEYAEHTASATPSTPDASELEDQAEFAEELNDVFHERRRGSGSSKRSQNAVDWEELQKTEEQEPRDEASDDSTALLLARLEQENDRLATNPKSASAKADQSRYNNRPPSLSQLKKLVNGPTPPSLRYSLLPAPPMTDLEFYGALVQDYKRTAQQLPTLLSKKIRGGIPPPLRGIVWQSMCGSRDNLLEDQFDILCGESSPYEGIIGKDIGRSFPGVEMFRDPEGDGQRMLARVLKCFSLYDTKIGYCQGLGFLVGPLLMHMGEKEAFCVLVRLMEHYDLRSCFLPDLSGLHVRIYQFGELLNKNLPSLAAHLEELQVEYAYVSQWFLSFFAVTCPLPMLFRIYDVIFAEGASETIMRVALSLMRKNEQKLLACTEFEDVMPLLLSRGLWDCYHYNADEFVNDFMGLTGVVTRESLQALEVSYKESKIPDVEVVDNIAVTAAKFLGRLWSGSNSSTKSTNLAAPSRPVSILRRTNSKQSLASTLRSVGNGSESVLSITSTDATNASRDSSNTDASSNTAQSTLFSNTMSLAQNVYNNSRDKDSQIEDLLSALSDLQKEQAITSTQLRRLQDDRTEDDALFRALFRLHNRTASRGLVSSSSENSTSTVVPSDAYTDLEMIGQQHEGMDRMDMARGSAELTPRPTSTNSLEAFVQVPEQDHEQGIMNSEQKAHDQVQENRENLSELPWLAKEDDIMAQLVERAARADTTRRHSKLQSNAELREDKALLEARVVNEVAANRQLEAIIKAQESIIQKSEETISEKDATIHDLQRDLANSRQLCRMKESEIRNMKAQARTSASSTASRGSEQSSPSASATKGLRELKLGRSSTSTTFSKRTSSLHQSTVPEHLPAETAPSAAATPFEDRDALLAELAQWKTNAAVAQQEREEMRVKLDGFRKKISSGASAAEISKTSTPTSAAAPAPAAGSGGFWGGWGKRSVSTPPPADKA